MKTCERCGLINPDTAGRCECGGYLVVGERPAAALRGGNVAGFWIRFASDLLDAVFLGILGWVISLFFNNLLMRLGERAVFVGMAVSLLYTGVLQSRIGGGQTLAKRLLNLRVLRMDGSLLSLDRSLVRWALLGFLCYGGAASYALVTVAPIVSLAALSAAIIGLQIALGLGCGLLVAFHPLKRGLHDLLTGSIVVRRGFPHADVIARGQNVSRDRRLIAAAAVVAVVAAVGSLFAFAHMPVQLEPAGRVNDAMAAMRIQNPMVADTHFSGSGGSQRLIIVSGYVPVGHDGKLQIPDAHAKLAALVRKEIPLDGVDAIQTVLRTGINIGIYSSYETSTERHLPSPPPQPQP